MSSWKDRLSWLRALPQPIPAEANTPSAVAEIEAKSYFDDKSESVAFQKEDALGEAYEIMKKASGYTVRGGETGLLYGVYALIFALETGAALPQGVQKPYYPLRMLNCWDNMSGDVERGYAGRSLWFEGGKFSYDPARIRQLGRMLGSVGVNVLCLNNVNVHQPAQHLLDDLLPDTAAFAALLRPFGVRLMLSIDYSQDRKSVV